MRAVSKYSFVRFFNNTQITFKSVPYLNCISNIQLVLHSSQDWIEIRDGKDENSPLIGKRICGNKWHWDNGKMGKCDPSGCIRPYSSSGNSLYLHFHSDDSRSKHANEKTQIFRFKIKTFSQQSKI